jgi:hypothetical protein
MKHINFFLLLAAFVMPLCVHAQSKNNSRSKEGDQVWLIFNYVKAESKPEFEKFMEDIFFNVLLTSKEPQRAEQYQKTRWLMPAQQNADSTWTYVFIMDPVVANADYDIEKLFQEQYGPEKSAELFKQYESYIDRSEFHTVVQSRISLRTNNITLLLAAPNK